MRINIVDNLKQDIKNDAINYLKDNYILRLKPSPIHGVGVFAVKDIPKGTQLFKDFETDELIYLILTDEEFDTFSEEQREMFNSYYFKYEGKRRIVVHPNELKMMGRYLNFAEENFNCTLIDNKDVTTKDIKRGEEIIRNVNSPINDPFGN